MGPRSVLTLHEKCAHRPLCLQALARADKTLCLAVNQASSITNCGTGCETLTLGHHPHVLPLSSVALTLPTLRPLFACEVDSGSLGSNGSPLCCVARRPVA